jgi:hypothetical protein
MKFVGSNNSVDNFGVDLKLNSLEAEEFYCEALRCWFEKEKGYDALSITGREFVINDGFEDLAAIYIHDSILRIKPMSEDPYEVLIFMLEFIAENHKKTIEVYNYLEENEEEILNWPNSNFYKKEIEEKEEIIEKEEASEEESDEWI